jgi:hypothetical protein
VHGEQDLDIPPPPDVLDGQGEHEPSTLEPPEQPTRNFPAGHDEHRPHLPSPLAEK